MKKNEVISRLGSRQVVMVIVIVSAIAALWWRFGRERMLGPQSDVEFPKVGSAAQDFSLPDISNGDKPVRLAQFRGKKAVVLNFWASWSPFSKDELRDWAYMQKEFSTSVAILAINRAEQKPIAERHAKTIDGAYGNYPLLLDSTDDIWKLYKGFAMPTSIFIDKKGIIRDVKFGPLTLDEMRERVRKTIND